MIKVFIDTSYFLRFYESNENAISLLDSLDNYKDHLIFPDQLYNELQRNRIVLLKYLLKQFPSSLDIKPYTTSFIKQFKEFNDIVDLKKNIKKNLEQIIAQLESMIDNENVDPVMNKFNSLYNDQNSIKLYIDDDIVNKAHKRKLLGNPPTSPDKYTIGDEVIWEMILQNIKDDLIIVTNDKTYYDNIAYLKREFKNVSDKEILFVTNKLTDVISHIGKKPPKKFYDLEEKYNTSTGIFVPIVASGTSSYTPILENEGLYFNNPIFSGVINVASKFPNPIIPGVINVSGFRSGLIYNTCPNCHSSYYNGIKCTLCGYES